MTWALGVLVLSACGEDCETYLRQLVAEATLTPDAVVPPVTDTAIAWASINLTESQTRRTYTARVIAASPSYACCDFQATSPTMDVQTVIAVHIHEGLAGENGPVLMTLSRPVSLSSGVEPYIVADDGGDYPSDRYDLIAQSEAYVDVHTTPFPDGQLRGPIETLVYDDTFRCVGPD